MNELLKKIHVPTLELLVDLAKKAQADEPLIVSPAVEAIVEEIIQTITPPVAEEVALEPTTNEVKEVKAKRKRTPTKEILIVEEDTEEDTVLAEVQAFAESEEGLAVIEESANQEPEAISAEMLDQAIAFAMSPDVNTPIPEALRGINDFWPKTNNISQPSDELKELIKKLITITVSLHKVEGTESVKSAFLAVGASRLNEVPDWLLPNLLSALTFANIDLRHNLIWGNV
jgi:hypothetical protein